MRLNRCLALAAFVGILASSYPTSSVRAQQQAQQKGPVFFVVELNVKEREEFDRDYASQAGALVTQHGGTFLVGGEKVQPVEGTPPEGVVIIVRFDSMDQARSFLDSPEYKKIVPVRQKTADTRSYLVQGAAAQ